MKDEERDLEGLANLGTTLHDIRRLVCHFMKLFWVRFGQLEARSMAEARRAEVSFFVCNLFVSVLGFLLLACCFYNLVLFL